MTKGDAASAAALAKNYLSSMPWQGLGEEEGTSAHNRGRDRADEEKGMAHMAINMRTTKITRT
jgi:hypothetical protein